MSDTGIYEKIEYDTIETPIDIINKNRIQNSNLPFCVQSAVYHKEGKNFSSYHYGFESASFTLTLGGCGSLTYRGKKKLLVRGDITYIGNKEVGLYGAGEEGWKFGCINMCGVCYDYFEKLWNDGDFKIIHVEDVDKYASLLKKITDNINQPYVMNELAICKYITEFLTDALCHREMSEPKMHIGVYPERILKAIDYIEENYAEDIKVSDIASMLYTEKTYFSRQFKKYIGKSPKEYQMECRLEKAALMLRSSYEDIFCISDKYGFTSHSLFSKLFKKAYGMTPSEYRSIRS